MSKEKGKSQQESNQSTADHANNAAKSKANTRTPNQYHQPNRPSN
ncbi:hypothetical protein [Paenibacillus swuensis]|nr:hypothetical protein [Paenibacillus swuensis]